ncbi:glycophorin-C-like [Ranitomeya imitator]|uniref:glycophorin-C-like n=1 Tax=Ranitomeya imitator TaxID=111125 RepID=UPI0037E8296D
MRVFPLLATSCSWKKLSCLSGLDGKDGKSDDSIIKNVNAAESSSSGKDAAVIGSVVAATVVVVMILVIVLLRYLFRHKGTYTTNEDKDTEFAENANVALKSDTSLQETGDESKKEYFI